MRARGLSRRTTRPTSTAAQHGLQIQRRRGRRRGGAGAPHSVDLDLEQGILDLIELDLDQLEGRVGEAEAEQGPRSDGGDDVRRSRNGDGGVLLSLLAGANRHCNALRVRETARSSFFWGMKFLSLLYSYRLFAFADE
jgi:hypothetical protein